MGTATTPVLAQDIFSILKEWEVAGSEAPLAHHCCSLPRNHFLT